MIKFITKIEPPTVKVFSPTGESYVLNEYEFNALRVAIKKANKIGTTGWTFESVYEEGVTSIGEIDKDGRTTIWPHQMEIIMSQLMELI